MFPSVDVCLDEMLASGRVMLKAQTKMITNQIERFVNINNTLIVDGGLVNCIIDIIPESYVKDIGPVINWFGTDLTGRDFFVTLDEHNS